MKKRFNLLLGSIVVIAMTQAAHALTWDVTGGNGATIDAGSGTWNTILSDPTSANTVWNNGSTNVIWSQTSATIATNSAVFGAPGGTGVGPYAITVAENVAATSLTFNTSGYTLSAAAAQTIISPTITVASGSSAAIGSNLTIKPLDGTSPMTLKGPGTLNINSGATVKDFGGNNVLLNTGVNVNVLTGGLLTASSQFVVGDVNGGAQLNVTGGSATLTNTGAGNIVVSNIGSGTGIGTAGLKITGGIVTNSSTTGGLRFGNNTVGTFTNNGTADLDGGILTVAKIYEGTGGTTNSTFNFNGGTLKVLAGTTFAPTFMTGLNNANVKEGGAFIDTNGVDTSINQALLHGGVAATDGGLTKTGSGILSLAGANTYTGATTINTGTLTVVTGGTLGASTAALNVNNTNTGAGNAVSLNLATSADTVTGSLSGTIATPSSLANTVTINNGGSGRNFAVNQTTNGTYAGVISGAGSFTLGASSTAVLTLTGANNYTGGTTVSAGRLISTRATAGGATAVASGATLEYAIASGSAGQGASTYTGAGTIQKTGGGTLLFSGSNSLINLSAGGLVDVQGGNFQLGNFDSSGNTFTGLGDINIASGAALDAHSTNVQIDKLTGTGTYQGGYFGSRTLTVGANNGTSTFNGTLQSNNIGNTNASVALIKTGNGTFILAGTVNTLNNSGDVLRVIGGTSATPSTLTLSPAGASAIGSTTTNNVVSIAPVSGDVAVLNQTAGTLNSTNISIGNTGVGTCNLSGGIVNTKKVELAYNGPFSSTGEAKLNVSGSAALNVVSNGSIVMGTYYARMATVVQTGGNVSLYSDAGTTLGGSGSLAFNGGGTASSYTLSGGTLAIPNITLLTSGGGAGGGTGMVNLNGGTLKITSASFAVPTGVTMNVQGSGLVANSGANIDTSGLSIAFNAALLHSGPNAIDGGLTKTGNGTLALSGTSTYTGATKVSAGVLAVNGSLANTSTTVANTARLQGSGGIGGAVTVQNGGTIAAGNSIESLATGALTLDGGSTFAYEIDNNALAGVAGDLTAVSGNLTLDVANSVLLTLSELGVAGFWTAGEKLTLISYSGTWNGGLFNYGGTLADDSIHNFSGMDWLFNYNDTAAGANFTGELAGSSYVTMTAVPESSTALIGSFGLLALLRRRRG